ncbi:MAG: hypothetical protein E7376_03570 [Clostridiales bacterium]|nr:hypothetical protein [Clostridiales bacterium]
MKEYDLSQYILRSGNVMLFPLTREEVHCLLSGVNNFVNYIRLPYFAKKQDSCELENIINAVDMENDYWFLNTQWVCVDIKARAIVGYLRLEKIEQFNKIVMQVTDESCQGITRDDVLDLFYRFLAGNDYYNIIVEDIDKKGVANEG